MLSQGLAQDARRVKLIYCTMSFHLGISFFDQKLRRFPLKTIGFSGFQRVLNRPELSLDLIANWIDQTD